MCGVCGIHGGGTADGAVGAMLEAMRRRGPDGSGIWADRSITLGHRRLAIVDLSERGRQPMASADGRIVVSVNGEFYNYPELRVELEASGAGFQSDCDSETAIHAYRRWGVGSFERFNGMFGFALWDSHERRLFLVRDRLGIKPLYYWQDGERTFFASDVQAIMAGSGRDRWQISGEGLAQYLAYENRFGAATMFEGIRMVLPGHYLRIDADGTCEVPFVKLSPRPRSGRGDLTAVVPEFRRRMKAAVQRHLMSDVPVAAYLSAGFDSSMVATMAAELMGGNGPATFTGTFREGGWYDEATGAGLVAGARGMSNTKVEISAATFRDCFDDMMFALEEPRMGTGALPQYVVARKAAETHKMILTGHGGDELFSGYPVFKFVLMARLLRRHPLAFLRLLATVRFSEAPHMAYFAWASLRRKGERHSLPRLFSDEELSKGLIGGDLGGLKSPPDSNEPVAEDCTYGQLLTQYLRDYLPGLLVVEDKISMAHGLESRTPLLDNELLRFAMEVDEVTKLSGGQLKAVPKAAARGILPEALFRLPKRGFPNPLSRWLRGELAPWMTCRLTGPETALTELFEPSFLEQTVLSYQRSWKRFFRPLDEIPTHRIWMLLCLESWIRIYRERLGVTLVAPGSRSAPERLLESV